MIETDRAMIQNPDDWPVWPILPMKRIRHGDAEMGIILAGHSTTIYRCNMFDPRLKTDPASIKKRGSTIWTSSLLTKIRAVGIM